MIRGEVKNEAKDFVTKSHIPNQNGLYADMNLHRHVLQRSSANPDIFPRQPYSFTPQDTYFCLPFVLTDERMEDGGLPDMKLVGSTFVEIYFLGICFFFGHATTYYVCANLRFLATILLTQL